MRHADHLLDVLGRRVRAARTARGWTLRELSEHSGVSLRFLVQLEAGEGNISVRRLAALATALGTAPAVLLADGAAAPGRPPHVALLGLRGAGKTTVGKRLARRLGMRFVELDRRVEETAHLTLSEIFSLHGEGYYRRLEREVLVELLDGAPMVLATGGGIVTAADTFALLHRRATTVWLRAAPEDHWNRVVKQGDRRPMANHPQAMKDLRALLDSREPLYSAAAITIETTGRTVSEVVRAAEAALR